MTEWQRHMITDEAEKGDTKEQGDLELLDQRHFWLKRRTMRGPGQEVMQEKLQRETE